MIRPRSDEGAAPRTAKCSACHAVEELREGHERQKCSRCGALIEPAPPVDGGDVKDDVGPVRAAGPLRFPPSSGSPEEMPGAEGSGEGRGEGVRGEGVRGEGVRGEGVRGESDRDPSEGREPDTIGDLETVRSPSEDGGASEIWHLGKLVAGRFRILALIGQGGMGKVYLAEDESLRRRVALKRIPQEILYDLDARDDLRQEANRLLDLAHENIVRVHTFYDGPTWPFIAMEYLEGPNLKSLLRERKQSGRTFSPEEVLVIARQVSAALTYAHDHSVVHRDLKPANLMLSRPLVGEITDDACIKITDFGISRVIADSTLRQTGRRSGTLPYMSPEQYRGDATSGRSDIYSFACTLYELLTGKPPFTTGDIGYQILNVEPHRLALTEAPRPMAQAILRGLSKDPEERFSSPEQFVGALEGRIKVPPRRWRREWVSLLSKIAAGIVFVLLVVTAVSAIIDLPPGMREPFHPAAGGSSGSPVPGTRFQREEIEALEARLRAEIIERLAGKEIGLPEGAGPRDRERDFTLELPEGRRPDAFPPDFLDRLLIHYSLNEDSESRVWEEAEQATAPSAGSRAFLLRGLKHGVYELRVYLITGEAGIQHERLFEEEAGTAVTMTFKVDLVPPDFTVEPAEPSLVSLEAEYARAPRDFRFGTYGSEAKLRVLPFPEPREFSRVEFYEMTGEGSGPSTALPENLWRVELPDAGRERSFVLRAFDRAGNRSQPVSVAVRRARLRVETVSVADVEGNTARLEGELSYEELEPPSLHFLIDGQAIESWRPGGEASPERFEVSIGLPRARNAIELRYGPDASDARAFDRPRILEAVVPAPRITFVGASSESRFSEPFPLRINEPALALEGRVEPYFEGLEVEMRIEVRMAGSIEPVELMVSGDTATATATFKETVALRADQKTGISFVAYYNDSALLEPPLPVVTVYCDRRMPVCSRVRLIEERTGEMVLDIEASEPLERLRGGLFRGYPHSPAGLQDLDLNQRVGSTAPVVYRVRMPGSYRPGDELQVEMTDRAGNWNSAQKKIEMGWSPTVRDDTRAVDTRSPFLREMGMKFLPYGAGDREISVTEVPEKAWKRFLGAEEEGAIDLPMVLGHERVERLHGFVEWFEEQADDGYDYFIPTVRDWLCAFADAEDVDEARQAIDLWFESFIDLPREKPYGQTYAVRIGSRKMNMTPSNLLDMESNVQEVVLKSEEDALFCVIGGNNQDEYRTDIRRNCLNARVLDPDEQELRAALTGLRLCRKPAFAR